MVAWRIKTHCSFLDDGKANVADNSANVVVKTAEKDSLRSWILLGCATVNLILVGALFTGLCPVFFVALLDEFGESKEKTGRLPLKSLRMKLLKNR